MSFSDDAFENWVSEQYASLTHEGQEEAVDDAVSRARRTRQLNRRVLRANAPPYVPAARIVPPPAARRAAWVRSAGPVRDDGSDDDFDSVSPSVRIVHHADFRDAEDLRCCMCDCSGAEGRARAVRRRYIHQVAAHMVVCRECADSWRREAVPVAVANAVAMMPPVAAVVSPSSRAPTAAEALRRLKAARARIQGLKDYEAQSLYDEAALELSSARRGYADALSPPERHGGGVRDLTRDGDVESNPGPVSTRLLTGVLSLSVSSGVVALCMAVERSWFRLRGRPYPPDLPGWPFFGFGTEVEIFDISGWREDLTVDGDVESNPGPMAGVHYATAASGGTTTLVVTPVGPCSFDLLLEGIGPNSNCRITDGGATIMRLATSTLSASITGAYVGVCDGSTLAVVSASPADCSATAFPSSNPLPVSVVGTVNVTGTTASSVTIAGFSAGVLPLWVSDYEHSTLAVSSAVFNFFCCLALLWAIRSQGRAAWLADSWNQKMHSLNGNMDREGGEMAAHSSGDPTAPYDPRFDVLRGNPFAALADDDFEDQVLLCAEEMPRASAEFLRSSCIFGHRYIAKGDVYMGEEALSVARHVADAHASNLKSKQRNGEPLSEVEKKKIPLRDATNAKAQLASVAKRVAQGFADWGALVDWLCGGEKVSSALSTAVFEECVKRNLGGGVAESMDKGVARGVAKHRPVRSIIHEMGHFSSRLRALQQSDIYARWSEAKWSDEPGSRRGSDGSTTSDTSTCVVTIGDAPVHEKVGDYSGHFARARSRLASIGGWQRDLTMDGDVEANPGPFSPTDLPLAEIGGYSARLQASRNKKMHSANGNTSFIEFPNTMADIKESARIRPLLEEGGTASGPFLNHVDAVAQVLGILGPQGVTMSSVPRETALRGATISSANAVTLLNDLNHPESLLQPATVRSGAAAGLIDSVRRVALFGIGEVRRMAGFPCVETADGAALRETLARSGNIRSDQVTALGFKTSDCAALLRLQAENNGDSLVSAFLKLTLYQLSRTWLQPANLLPIGGEAGKYDAFTALDVNPDVVLNYNTGTVFNSDCGSSSAPIFPYSNATAAQPRIAFHEAKATIPVDEPWFMLRPGLLLQNDSGYNALNYALFALCVAPYPCGIHTVTMSTVDTAGGNADDQEFFLHSDSVHIPGITTTIHLYIPSDQATPPPTSYVAARLQATVVPTAGPTAWGALAANAELQINAVGQPFVSYGLADYLGTWMADASGLSPVDATTLVRFKKQLAELYSRSKDLDFAWDLACGVAARYPAMFEAAPGTPTYPAANSAASAASQNFFALQPHVMVGDYPEDQDLYDFYVPSLNPMWFNKIMSGMYLSVSDGGAQPPVNRDYDGSPRALQYALMTVRTYALTAEHVYNYMRMGRQVWQNSFTQQNYTGVLAAVRDFFAQVGLSTSVVISNNGYALELLHVRVSGTEAARDQFGYSLWCYINAPRVGFQGAWNATTMLNTPCPCVLPDIWLQTTTRVRTLCSTPLLSSNKLLSGLPTEASQVTPLGAGAYTVPLKVESQAREVGLDTVPLIDEVEVFHSRLVWHTMVASQYTLDGAIYATSTVTSGNVVAQKSVRPDWTMLNLVAPSVLTAKTTWFAFMTPIGLRLAVGVSSANGATLMTQIVGQKTVTGVACWLIRNAQAMPNVIVDAGGQNKGSKIYRPVKGSGESSPSSEPASVAGQASTPSAEPTPQA